MFESDAVPFGFVWQIEDKNSLLSADIYYIFKFHSHSQNTRKDTQALINDCTCSLEVERYHLAANGPQWVRVIVGGLHTLAFRIDPAQCFAVVQ